MKSDDQISGKIESKFSSNKEIIDFKILDSFEWDEMMILGPYADVEKIQKFWRLDLSKIERHLIKSEDGINLIIFFKDSELIKIAEVSRGIGDFQNLEILIPKSRTKFLKEDNGITLVNDNLNKYSFYRDITIFPKFKDFQKKRGLLLNHLNNSNSNKGLQYIKNDSIHILILERIIRINEWKVAYELLDTVKLVNNNKLKIGFGYCERINPSDDETIFAFSIINDSAFFKTQLKSWRIDFDINKLVEIQETELKCVNDEFQNDP
ncbi:hypothetical protein ACFQO1_05245 [Jejudonia soesokkakensis]|uniref:Uncharacterized protein n=1 Tax=Jejudonia soesokkakensis TaxID=1323432 RepID=A0ABW2MQA9_9FLAO